MPGRWHFTKRRLAAELDPLAHCETLPFSGEGGVTGRGAADV